MGSCEFDAEPAVIVARFGDHPHKLCLRCKGLLALATLILTPKPA